MMRHRVLLYIVVALVMGACNMSFGLRQAFFPEHGSSAVSRETIKFWVGSYEDYQASGTKVGCDSYLLPVDTGVARGASPAQDMQVALEALFSPEQNHSVAETEDWIKQLGLSIESINIVDGEANVKLGGTLMGIGSCGDAILEAQILQTIFQFEAIESAMVSDGVMNLRQVTDMSDRLTLEQLQNYIYSGAENR